MNSVPVRTLRYFLHRCRYEPFTAPLEVGQLSHIDLPFTFSTPLSLRSILFEPSPLSRWCFSKSVCLLGAHTMFTQGKRSPLGRDSSSANTFTTLLCSKGRQAKKRSEPLFRKPREIQKARGLWKAGLNTSRRGEHAGSSEPLR